MRIPPGTSNRRPQRKALAEDQSLARNVAGEDADHAGCGAGGGGALAA